MGLTPTPDYHDGTGCTDCFGIGQTFGDVPTPIFVRAIFTGILKCSDDSPADGINGTYCLTQELGLPCDYGVILPPSGGVGFSFSYDIFNGRIFLKDKNGFWWFISAPVKCSTSGTNIFVKGSCGGVYKGYGGSCVINWGPGIVCY